MNFYKKLSSFNLCYANVYLANRHYTAITAVLNITIIQNIYQKRKNTSDPICGGYIAQRL